MMKRSIFAITLFSLVSISAISGVANAYWIWTPETKKFTNPKYAVKDSPKEQFDWAMSFYNAKDFQRAATEFEKLAKQYEFSEHASKAQYYVGLCYENMNKYYLAYQNYQKAIDNFPHIANTEEILAREFAIANLYLSKPGPKVLGTDIMAPLDRAVEIFKKIVENAPYGKFAEESQFKLGEALKKSERYEEAVQAFHKIIEDYPKSKLATQAMYEESHCAYKASLKPAYDAAATDNAIKTFEKFVYRNKDADLAKDADTTMKRLKDNVSEKSFKAAEFYEAQGKTQAAIIYYQDVIDTYPGSTFVNRAKAKIEALRARGTKKAAAPIDLSKKKSKRVVREKKPWSPFRFKSKSGKPEEKAEAVAPETSKKKTWNPFSFKGEKKKTEVAAQTTQAKETSPKKKPWNLFNLGAKKKPVVKEIPQKNPWRPLSFDAAKKVEATVVLPEPQTVEAPRVESPAQPVETAALEAPIAEIPKAEVPEAETPAIEVPKKEETVSQGLQEEPKAKAWKPFNFKNKKASVAKKLVIKEASPKKKPWKPLSLDTTKKTQPKKTPESPAVVKIPVTQIKEEEVVAPPVEAPAALPETQAVEAPKVEPPAQLVETPAAETLKDEEESPRDLQEAPKGKAWRPFNFDIKKEPVVKEAPEKRGWKPLYFGTNDEPMATTNRRW